MTLITPTESTAVVTAAPANETSSAKRARRGGGRPSAYLAKDGTPCIGVTSVCSRVKESAALIAWANKEGLAGRSIHETRDRACEVGHYAHALVDASIHERERPPRPNGMNDEDEGRALKAFEAYATWRDHHQVEIIDTEVPLVCNLFRFGGTRDALAKVMGELILFDWKSSNDVYREYIMQIAAYRHLARVNGMGDLKSAGLVRFGKAYGNFEYHYWPEALLDDGWDAFKYALEFCKLDQKLKQAVR